MEAHLTAEQTWDCPGCVQEQGWERTHGRACRGRGDQQWPVLNGEQSRGLFGSRKTSLSVTMLGIE